MKAKELIKILMQDDLDADILLVISSGKNIFHGNIKAITSNKSFDKDRIVYLEGKSIDEEDE